MAPAARSNEAQESVGSESLIRKRAPHGEGPVRDIVNLAGDPLFLVIVDEKCPNLQGRGLIHLRVGSRVRLRVGDLPVRAQSHRVDFRGSGQQRARGKKHAQR